MKERDKEDHKIKPKKYDVVRFHFIAAKIYAINNTNGRKIKNNTSVKEICLRLIKIPERQQQKFWHATKIEWKKFLKD